MFRGGGGGGVVGCSCTEGLINISGSPRGSKGPPGVFGAIRGFGGYLEIAEAFQGVMVESVIFLVCGTAICQLAWLLFCLSWFSWR